MKESEADIHIEKLNARILLIAGTGDEMWPSDYSVRYLEKSLRENHYKREYKAILYKGAGHLLGIMPSLKRELMLYKMIPIIGIFYQRFRDSRSICMDALEKSEREIVEWLVNSGKPENALDEIYRVLTPDGILIVPTFTHGDSRLPTE